MRDWEAASPGVSDTAVALDTRFAQEVHMKAAGIPERGCFVDGLAQQAVVEAKSLRW